MTRNTNLYHVVALLLFLLSLPGIELPLHAAAASPRSSSSSSNSSTSGSKSKKKPAHEKSGSRSHLRRSRPSTSGKEAARRSAHSITKEPTKKSIKLTSAFLASAELRPMAQQLSATRSAAAYAGVLNYAHGHPGEGAATAYLALGHAQMLDHHYPEAISDFALAKHSGEALDDYADYLAAQANIQANRPGDAYALLDHFADRYPDSIFDSSAPILLANAHLQQNDGPGALRALQPLAGSPVASQATYLYPLARAYQLSGNTAQAAPIFLRIYTTLPLTFEAIQSATQLQAIGSPLTPAQRKVHADALFNARRYSEASNEYNAIGKNNPQLSSADRDALAIYSAICEFKLKHLTRRDVERLPDTSDDTAAAKLYMLAELSRSEDDRNGHDAIIAEMLKRFPESRWLEEALYSGGNMYLLKNDPTQAIYHYSSLVRLFPHSTYAPSAHWRTAWLNYRIRNYSEAARLMDEQIVRYRGGIEIPGALYWRGRIYEDEEHNFSQAENYYRRLISIYANSYYAGLARQRVAALGNQHAVAPAPALSAAQSAPAAELVADLPENDVHLIRARLLANAALNEYIRPEIDESATAGEWGALAQGEIYASYGEYWRALQAMKRSQIAFIDLPIDQVPTVYWHLLFPQPYWTELVADSGRNGLDPYLVASLIRQESEFNPGAVSSANAYGLMQLLPSVGKSLAKKQGIKRFATQKLLDPTINLQLGTANLKLLLDRFGGQVEYALAAYNAGDTPVRQWLTEQYKDVPEFVESIPYTQTREYVQAIVRNREMYRKLYPVR